MEIIIIKRIGIGLIFTNQFWYEINVSISGHTNGGFGQLFHHIISIYQNLLIF